jgi:hypothetical protein
MFSIVPFIMHYVFSMIVILPGIMLYRKLYKNIKDEEHLEKGKVIQRIMKTYTIIQCISWPLCLIFGGIIAHVSPIWDVVNPSIMHYLLLLYCFIDTLMRGHAAFNSLVIALCRYAFVVFGRQSEKFGIKRLRKFFITCSVGMPIFLAIWDFCIISHRHHFSFFGFCQDTANSTVELNDGPRLSCEDVANYSLANKYLPLVIVNAMRLTYHATFIVIYSNVPEAFIYAHIFVYSAR